MNSPGYREVHLACGDFPALLILVGSVPSLRANDNCDPNNVPPGTLCYELPIGNEPDFEKAAKFLGITFEYGIVGGGVYKVFRIFSDVNGDNQMVLVGSVNTTDIINRMVHVEHLDYGISRGLSNNLTVINTKKPNNPTQDAVANLGALTAGIHAEGHLVAVAIVGGVQLVDCSTPGAPILMGLATSGGADGTCCFVQGDYLYAGMSDGAVHVWDIQDPNNPDEKGSISLGAGTPAALWLDMAVLYAIDDVSALFILNIDNPSSPSILTDGISALGGAYEHLKVHSYTAFVSGSAAGTAMWDVGQFPPKLLDEVLVSGSAVAGSTVGVQGRRMYFGDPAGSTLRNYRIGGSFCSWGAFGDLQVDGQLTAQLLRALDGYFRGEVVADYISAVGGKNDTNTGVVAAANYLAFGPRWIMWSDATADPNGSIAAPKGSILSANDGSVWRNIDGATAWTAM